jgi:hypothetical protein
MHSVKEKEIPMLAQIVRRLALEALADLRPRELSFWDLKYIYHFGIPKLPPTMPAPVPWPPGPQPDPDPTSLAARVAILEQLVFDLIDVPADPSPQPAKSVLLNRELRLESVRRLTEQFETGLKQLNEEQKQLTTNRK